jgi:hypothetical protein
MQITISRNYNDETWGLRPTSGLFEGVLIATAERLSLKQVSFKGRTMVGAVKALWGVTILCEQIYDDVQTIHALGLTGVFDQTVGEPLVLDYDGYIRSSRTKAETAQRVVVLGAAVFAKGVE